MPAIGHLVYGIALVIPFLAFSDDRVTKKASVIFVFTNYVGPDSAYVFFFLPFPGHSFFGYLIWALLLAFSYSYFSRFSLKKTEKFFEITDDGKRELRWRDAYLVSVAGGICHNFIDMIFHKGFSFHIWTEKSSERMTLMDIYDWEDKFGYYHSKDPAALTTLFILFTLFFLIWYIFSKDYKDAIILFVVLTLVLVVGLFLTDGVIYSEFDVGTTFFTFVWIFLPMVFMVWAIKDAQLNPLGPNEAPRLTADQKIILVSGVILFLTIAVIGIGVYFIIKPEFLSEEIKGIDNTKVIILGSLLIGIAIPLVIMGILILKRVQTARIICISILWLTWYLVIPTFLIFMLCEKEVVNQFRKDKIDLDKEFTKWESNEKTGIGKKKD